MSGGPTFGVVVAIIGIYCMMQSRTSFGASTARSMTAPARARSRSMRTCDPGREGGQPLSRKRVVVGALNE